MTNESKQLECPYCGTEMVRWFVRCSDNSGWLLGWYCNCEPTEHEVNELNAKGDDVIQVMRYSKDGKNWDLTERRKQ